MAARRKFKRNAARRRWRARVRRRLRWAAHLPDDFLLPKRPFMLLPRALLMPPSDPRGTGRLCPSGPTRSADDLPCASRLVVKRLRQAGSIRRRATRTSMNNSPVQRRAEVCRKSGGAGGWHELAEGRKNERALFRASLSATSHRSACSSRMGTPPCIAGVTVLG